jgi:hypothetical protein
MLSHFGYKQNGKNTKGCRGFPEGEIANKYKNPPTDTISDRSAIGILQYFVNFY